MSDRDPAGEELFNQFHSTYDEVLNRGVSATGEDAEFFLQERVAWVSRLTSDRWTTSPRVLDFGCGTGKAAQYFLSLMRAKHVLGVDVSTGLLAQARANCGSPSVRFSTVEACERDGSFDLAYCNGVFHHIPPAERLAAAQFVHASLRSGGLFAFWENNPWNPGTRYVMSKIEFDRDAITLTPNDARRLLRAAGFRIIGTTYRFFYPRALRLLRFTEPSIRWIPLGGQYQVLCQRT